MKLIAKDTDCAIAAVTHLAERPRRTCSATDMSRSLEMSYPFLRKIMQALSRNGIVRSRKGPGGGFMLAKDPGSITVGSIIEIFQGGIRINDCMVRNCICPRRAKCMLREKLFEIQDKLVGELMDVTIVSLLAEPDAASAGIGRR